MADSVYTGVRSLDITKCFDAINHKILLAKMELYGVQSNSILSWFGSYLTGRQQTVFCLNILYCKREIQIGIPAHFVLYVNDSNMHVYHITFTR